MAAALRAAEGGGYIFPKILRGDIFKFFRPGGVYPPYPLFPTPALNIMFETMKPLIVRPF